MLRTDQINDAEASKWFKWLNEEASFRNDAIDAFREEMGSSDYKPLPNCTYYVVYEDSKALLLIRTSLQNSIQIAISFARLFNKVSAPKSIEAHIWLKNALEEKIVPKCLRENIELIMAKAVNYKCDIVFAYLERELPIKEVLNIERRSGYGGTTVYIKLSNSIHIYSL